MNWVKKNPHLLTLLIVALLVVASSALVFTNVRSYNEKFEPVRNRVIPKTAVPPLPLGPLEEAQAQLTKPSKWQTARDAASLFVPVRYSIQDGAPVKFGAGGHWPDRLTKQIIPDQWFAENRLPVTDPTAPVQDPDKDGFLNEDEWREKTDPNAKESHPPYYSKLYVKQYIRVPFRLKFNAYDGDPKKDKLEDMSFQINTLDLRQPTVFLKVGDMVPRTKFKIEKFEYKMVSNPSVGGDEDRSELTIVDTETNAPVVLILAKITDSPDSFALFTYLWSNPPLDIRVRKLGEFVLKPDVEQRYKLLDINDTEAVVQTPAGKQVTISRMPAGYP